MLVLCRHQLKFWSKGCSPGGCFINTPRYINCT